MESPLNIVRRKFLSRTALGVATWGTLSVRARSATKGIAPKDGNAVTTWLQDGMNDSTSVYTYGALDERVTIQYRDRPCQINTYRISYPNATK